MSKQPVSKNGVKVVEDGEASTHMPTLAFLLICHPGGGKFIENLDAYYSDKKAIKGKYLAAVDHYGYNNVAYCKIISASVKREVSFIDDDNEG